MSVIIFFTSDHFFEKLKIKKTCVNWITLMVKYHMPLSYFILENLYVIGKKFAIDKIETC